MTSPKPGNKSTFEMIRETRLSNFYQNTEEKAFLLSDSEVIE